MKIKKSLNFSILQFCNRSEGQSLAELLVALAVGGFLVISAAVATTVILRNEMEAKNAQVATFLSQNEIDSIRVLSQSNWLTLYNLQKGASAHYFIIPSATSTASTTVISGKESVLADDVTNGLAGYWKFDEGVGEIAYDFSGNGYNASSTSWPTWTASSSCKTEGCLNFNGTNNCVDTGTRAGLDITGAITVGAWVKTSNSATQIIVARGLSSSDHTYALYTTSNHLKFNWANGTSFGTDDILEGVTNVIDGSWHYLVGVGDPIAQKMYVYVDGVLDNSKSKTTVPSSNSTKVAIGNEFGYSAYFTGLIDDVRIYNRALSASEISQLYRSSIFNRYFSAENINRDSCGAGNISTDAVTSCLSGPLTSGVAEDPSTQKITTHIEWQNGGNLNRTEYVSRSVNKIIDETDWSGGSGQSGIVTSPNGRYASSTGIATSTGSIRLQGL